MRIPIALLLTTLVLSTSTARAGTPELGYADASVVAGLVQPTALDFLPDGRILVIQQTGELRLVDNGVATTLADLDVCKSGEMGLLGLAIDPDFTSNGYLYLYRSHGPGCVGDTRVNEIVRVTMAPDDTVDIGSLTTLLTGIGTFGGNHNGGGLRIGPDLKLYAGAGDAGTGDNQGGPGSSTNPYSQDLASLNGKVLRINLDGTIPADNPFIGQAGVRPEIYAYGFRNPFRLEFDPATGSLWVGDVGDATYEELDIMQSGGNYSWPYCEALKPNNCQMPADISPAYFYPHAGPTSLGNCVIAGDFAGAAFDAEAGDYVFGDCTKSRVYRARLNATRDGFESPPVRIATNASIPSSFTTGPDGAVYYTTIGGDEIRRISRQLGDQPLLGKRLLLTVDPDDASRSRLSISSSDRGLNVGLGNGSAADPVVHGGSLRVVSTAGDTFDATYPLPAGAMWSTIGETGSNRGYRYDDSDQVNGPVRSIRFKQGRLIKISASGAGLTETLASSPDPVDVVLTPGDQRYCFRFGNGQFTADASSRSE